MQNVKGDRVEIAAKPRTVFGKKVRFLRREGWTPANVFGHHFDSTAVQLRTRELEHLLAHAPRNALLSLLLDGHQETVLIKVVQRKQTSTDLYHVDFYRVSMTERLRADVPIVFMGEAPAASMEDATILAAIDALHVECLPGDLPTQIEVDLSRLEHVDDSIYVRDLALPSGVTCLVAEDELVVKALAPRVEEEVPEVEEAEAAAEAEAAEAEAPEAAEQPAEEKQV